MMIELENQDNKSEYCIRDQLRCMYLEHTFTPDDEIDTVSNQTSFFKKISTRLFRK
ncbi:MAG: hypothetical protein NT038_10460 [Euryarchaeota archaeon]|nr:hypothetical protein [Euryarchaeota archaeon]